MFWLTGQSSQVESEMVLVQSERGTRSVFGAQINMHACLELVWESNG